MEEQQTKLKCAKCGSSNINVQLTNEVKLVKQHHGLIWWLLVGWWWLMIKWIFFAVPALILKVFKKNKKYKTKNITHKNAVCQDCGNVWEIK